MSKPTRRKQQPASPRLSPAAIIAQILVNQARREQAARKAVTA